MNRILFIVCPLSSTEAFIRKACGDGHYFLTVPGAIPDLEDPFTLETIRNLVVEKGVRSIRVVNDCSCRFIEAVVEDGEMTGMPAVGSLAGIFVTSGLDRAESLSVGDLKMRLAECNVLRQLERMEDSPALKETMTQFGVRSKGIVTCRETGRIMDLNTRVRNRVSA